MVNLLETNALNATTNPLICWKVPTLQLNLNASFSLEKTTHTLKKKQHMCDRFATIDVGCQLHEPFLG